MHLTDNDINGLDEAASRGVVTTISSTYSNVSVKNNEIHDSTTGIYTNPHTGNIDVRFNDIYDNVAGIGGFTGATVRYNEFSGAAGEAIGVDASYDGSVVSYNNFLTGQKLNTYGPLSQDVQAPNNFWADGGAASTGVTDEVDFTPEAGSAYDHI